MEYLSTGKVLIVDLPNLEIEEEDLEEELFNEHFGGAGLNLYFYDKYSEEDPIVIGTGLLTGTLFPGSSLGIITARSPRNGKISHAPFTLKNSIELKYAGFDYVVIKGKASDPVYLWIHDGVADLNNANDVWGKNVWETTDIWREEIGDEVLQTLVIGRSGELGSDLSQICLNYWSSGDRFGFGKVFGEKKLKGIAIRGMGILEIADPEGFVKKSLELFSKIKERLPQNNMGIEGICALSNDKELPKWLKPLIHRHIACYNTLFATNTFVFLEEDPSLKNESSTSDPGVLLTDPDSLINLKKAGLSAKESCELLKIFAQEGIDPAGITYLVLEKGLSSKADVLEKKDSLLNESVKTLPPFSDWAPKSLCKDEKEWFQSQVLAYVFGIHPIFMLLYKELLTIDLLLEITNIGTDLDLDLDSFNNLIEKFKQ